jgi:dTDP-glucose 4,6-dehydratase
MSETLILTGCAGFIGLNFLNTLTYDGLREKFSRIITIDKLGYATQYNREQYSKCCFVLDLERFDLSIKDVYQNKLLKFDSTEKITVLSFASESHVDRSINTPSEIYIENVEIPAYLLQSIPLSQISTYYHISTDEVYGSIPLDKITDKNNWFTTSTQYNPGNPYAASKLAQDAYLLSMSHTFGLPLRILRLANQFGCYQHLEKMIPASITRVLNGTSIKVYGAGTNMRQWTWVETTAEIIKQIIFNGTSNLITHIADERFLFDNNYVAKMMLRILGAKGIYGKIEYIPDRLGHDSAYALVVNNEVLGKYIDSFELMLNKTIDYYIAQNKKE